MDERGTIVASCTPDRPANFDRVARLYAPAEYLLLGSQLQRTRTCLLLAVQGARRALVLGDGDGRFLARLLRANPQLQALAIDTSAAMLALLRRRCTFAGERLATRHASATTFLADLPLGDVDLVVTHFFLDCLTGDQVEVLASVLARRLAPDARWLLSDFGIPAGQPWRMLAQACVRTLYAVFRVLTGLRVQGLPSVQTALRSAGWCRIQHHSRLKGLLYSEVWELSPESRRNAASAAPLSPAAPHLPLE